MARPIKKDVDWTPLTPPGARSNPDKNSSLRRVYGVKGLTPDVLRTISNEANIANRKDLEAKVQKTVNRQGASVDRLDQRARRKIERLAARSERYSAKELKSDAKKAGSTAKREIRDEVRKMRVSVRRANSFGGRMGGGAGGGMNIEQLK